MAPPIEHYAARLESAETAAARAEWRARRLSWARLLVAVVTFVALHYATRDGASPLAWLIGGVGGAVFVTLVVLHGRSASIGTRERQVAAACRAGIARCRRTWAELPAARVSFPAGGPNATARDLDVFGDFSLFRLLDVSSPALGGARLIEWLLTDPADVAVIEQRQQSVAALRERPGFLIDAAVIGRHGGHPARASSRAPIAHFVTWSGETPAAPRMWQGRGLIATISVVLLVALIEVTRRVEGLAVALVPVIIALLVMHLVLAVAARRHLTATLAGIGDLLAQLRGLDASMRRIVVEEGVPGEFGVVQAALREQGASDAFAKLDLILRWNEVRLTPMAHWPMNAVVALDVHIAAAVERWRARYGAHVAEWVDRASSAQAITAMATIGYENPAWTMPVVHDDATAPCYLAERTSHPLLAPEVAVSNPVQLARPGSLLALSGSNMSGKTTYLRAIGLNAVLALAGGPVSAAGMTLRRARVRSSVRVEDALGSGVSLFLAEVTRLRDIVRDAESGGSPVLFLFDEILHGTNAADRRYASQVVLRRLLGDGSYGVLTTHDPDLVTDLLDSPFTIEQGHFRETAHRGDSGVQMSFDYLLRPGPTTSANARLILELVGLTDAERV